MATCQSWVGWEPKGKRTARKEGEKKKIARSNKLHHHPLSCSVEQQWKTTMPLDGQDQQAQPSLEKKKVPSAMAYPEAHRPPAAR